MKQGSGNLRVHANIVSIAHGTHVHKHWLKSIVNIGKMEYDMANDIISSTDIIREMEVAQHCFSFRLATTKDKTNI